MKVTASRTKSFSSLSAALLVSCSSLFGAANEWRDDNGNWLTGNWQLGTPPNSADHAVFSLNTSSPATSIVVDIGDNEAASAAYLSIARGKTVEIALGTNASLSGTAGTWQIGSATGSGATSAPGALTISGPSTGSASVAIGAGGINIGSQAAQVGNTLTMSGNLDIAAAGGIVVGRFGNSNLFTIDGGVNFNGTSLWVSATQAIANGIGNGNGTVISGAGTEVSLAPTSNLALLIAARPTTNLASQQSGNYVSVEDGAVLRIDSVNSSSSADVKVGDLAFRSGNYLRVTGAGSLMELKGNTQIIIGANSSTSYDNSVTVDNGGVIKNDGTTTIVNSRTSGGKNRLVVGSSGTLLTGGDITVSGGLLQLADGGNLRGQTVAGTLTDINIIIQGQGSANGRFEAAGSGLASNVTTTIRTGSTLAVGLASATTASGLTLSSTVNLEAGSILELSIFGNGSIDSINLASTGSLVVDSGAVFALTLSGYTVQAGDSWNVFTGETSNIVGDFDMTLSTLPTLGGDLSWDYSQFNEAGGWQIAVIPEPSSIVLLLAGGVFGINAFRRTRRGTTTH
jgi:hypothetical protein